ncbi:MAG: hypothetical protein EOO81_00555 [Oxalobacteraceae bacterium]|nr:MAG: hypothetical protein EOO81_00555 [Oxalobacteraceae bacterium]
MALIKLTFGPGQQYPDLPSAWAAIPSDSMGTDSYWLAGTKTEFNTNAVIELSGKPAGPNNTITISPDNGHGYMDHPGVLTNPLAYNPDNGLAFRCTGAYSNVIYINNDYVTVRGLQIKNAGGGNSGGAVAVHLDRVGTAIENNVIDMAGPNGYYAIAIISPQIVRNNTIFISGGSAHGVMFYDKPSALGENNTVVRSSALGRGGYAFDCAGSSVTLNNNLAIGFDVFDNSGHVWRGSNNATDLQSINFGTGNKTSLVAADNLYGVAGSSADLRLKAGSVLIDAGTAPTDTHIPAPSGNRQQGVAADIGAWEYPQAIQAPTATVTAIEYGAGQSVTISGITTGSPDRGTMTLTRSSAAGNHAENTDPVDIAFAPDKFAATFHPKVGEYLIEFGVGNAYYQVQGSNSLGTVNVIGAYATSVIQEAVDGQVLRIHGTYGGAPSSALLLVPADTAAPDGAIGQEQAVTLKADGSFQVEVALPAGRYASGILAFTNAAGTSLPQPGTSPVVILGISGNPTVPDDPEADPAPGAAKTASIDMVSTNGIPIDAGPTLKFAWFDQVTPDLFDAPTDTGTAVIGQGGTVKVALANSTKTSGQVGWLVVTNSDGNPETVHKAFSGPVKVD